MPKTYEYSLGSVRAREKHLFTQSDIESMLTLKDVGSLAAFLRDKGFGDGDTVEEILRSGREKTVEYLYSIVPDERIFDAFLLVNDVHNIKAVIKGLLSGSEYKSLYMMPSTVDFETIETAVKENEFELLPNGLSESAEKAYDVLAHTADARMADAYLDRACMELQLKKAKESKIDFLYDYLSAEIFFRLVKIAIRACLTDSPKDYYETALCESYGDYNKDEIITLSLKGLDALLGFLSSKNIYNCSAAVEAYKQSPAAFERVADNILNSLAKNRCKRQGSGAEPALGYYLARQTEEKAAHIIAVGIQTNTEPNKIRERLRELYG